MKMQLPFKGRWLVIQGYKGESVLSHKDPLPPRWDFVKINAMGQTHKNAPDIDMRLMKFQDDVMRDSYFRQYAKKKLEDFFCYQQEILAVGEGIVVDVRDGFPDLPPGPPDKTKLAQSNHIIIRHNEGLYSRYVHFSPSTLMVRKGDLVKQGQILGVCGNSGHTMEPHLHFEFLHSPDNRRIMPMEYKFSDFWLYVDGKKVFMDCAEPEVGGEVEPAGKHSDE